MCARIAIEPRPDLQLTPPVCFCGEMYHLIDDFLDAVRELNLLHTEQTQAVIVGDRDFARFDLMIYAAQQRKDAAKYAWMAHVENHCGEDRSWLLGEPVRKELQPSR
jgi:hypothetical protein